MSSAIPAALMMRSVFRLMAALRAASLNCCHSGRSGKATTCSPGASLSAWLHGGATAGLWLFTCDPCCHVTARTRGDCNTACGWRDWADCGARDRSEERRVGREGEYGGALRTG